MWQIVAAAAGAVVSGHPFRRWDRRSLWNFLEGNHLLVDRRLAGLELLEGITAIGTLNGSSRDSEKADAAALARVLVLPGVGGSDAHSPDDVGSTATWFPDDIVTDGQLVAALRTGYYRAVDRRR